MPPHLSKAQFSRYRKLVQRKYRESEGLFLAEGLRTVEQLLHHGVLDVQCLIIDDSIAFDERTEGVLSDFETVYQLDHSSFNSLCDTEQSQGILAVIAIPSTLKVQDLSKVHSGLILATDGIQDPGNMGAIYRTAAWFGASCLMSGKGSVDLYNAKSVRSTAGALGALKVANGLDLPETLGQLTEEGWKVYLLDAGPESRSIVNIKPTGKDVIVVGNEANGISPLLKSDTRFDKVIIPGHSEHVESLNAAMSVSIALYHFSAG